MNGPRAKTGLPFPIRAVQLDVARHLESVDYIRSYSDFVARQGFNTLVLYLEGRVRTSSFPYRAKAESYTLKDMDTVVRHARSIGLDVVPVVSNLGHAEQFLGCKELAALSEERDGRGRFGPGRPSVFCPSLDEGYSFFGRYFKELAEVFTGPHWHVGLDECWNLGFCNRCRERWEKEGLGALFTGHVLRAHQLVRTLGKRMWMWDDFDEWFPKELERTPKDVVMCHWGYDSQVEREGQQAHFANRWRTDWLALYRKLKLDALICPVSSYWNTHTFTDYGRRRPVIGGLLTQWEGTPRFWPGNAALVAFTGRLWNQRRFDPETAWDKGLDDCLPNAGPVLKDAVREMLRLPGSAVRPGKIHYRWTQADTVQRAAARMALALFRRERQADPAFAESDFLDELDFQTSGNLLLWELRELELEVFDPRRVALDKPRLQKRINDCQAEAKRLIQYWDAWYARASEPRNPSDQKQKLAWHKHLERIAALQKCLGKKPTSRHWMLVLRLFLQDFYGAPRMKVSVASGKLSLSVAEGSFKHGTSMANLNGGFYDLQVPFEWAHRPDAVRLEGGGYGGQGVAFVQLVNPTACLFPKSIKRISGPVANPQAVLVDDSSFVTLGRTDIQTAIHIPIPAGQTGTLELELG
jgi:hypothetical protein